EGRRETSGAAVLREAAGRLPQRRCHGGRRPAYGTCRSRRSCQSRRAAPMCAVGGRRGARAACGGGQGSLPPPAAKGSGTGQSPRQAQGRVRGGQEPSDFLPPRRAAKATLGPSRASRGLLMPPNANLIPLTVRAVGLGCRAYVNGGKDNATGHPCLQTWEMG